MSDQDEGGGSASCGPPIPPTQMTPRSSLGSAGFSSGSSTSPSSSSSSSSKTAVSECLGAWLNYLNSLNNLCASGYRLSQTISNLVNEGPAINPGLHAQSAWDDLARASAVATSTVKSHVVAVLQEYVTQPLNSLEQEIEQHRVREHNQGIISEVAQTMINLQHQFCVASYDSFAHIMYSQQQQQMMEANEMGAYPSHNSMVIKMGHGADGSSSMGPSSRSRTTSPHFQPPHLHSAHRSLYGSEHSSCGLDPPQQPGGQQPPRGASPHQDIRGPSPIQGFLDNVRGPLPNPGHLLGMKAPFYRGSRSPLNFPLFPLAGQRRWSEAAAGEVCSGDSVMDAESQMRRWSMPWEATKTDRNASNWHQTRIMPISKLAVPPGAYNQMTAGAGGMNAIPHAQSRSCSDRSQSTTPDSVWQSSITSQDGLAEAIQLLSCKPANRYQGPLATSHSLTAAPFIEEPQSVSDLQQEAWNQSQQHQPK